MQQTDYTPLITRVTDSLGKSITDKQIGRLHAEFNRIGLNKATEVVRRVERMQSLPNNIVGLILNIIDEVNDEFSKKLETTNNWKTHELCTTPDDFEYYFKVTAFLMKLKKDERIEYFPNNYNPKDLESWIAAGRPATWTPVLDKFLAGFEPVYKNEKACTEYMKRFYQFLKDNYK